MIILYKDGERSPILHEVDARAWIAAGWSKQLPESGAQTQEVEDRSEDQPESAQNTEEYLKGLYQKDGWLAIKEIATKLGIEKPSDGWDKAIPAIVEEGWTPMT